MIFFQEYNQSDVYQNDEYTRILSRDKGYKRHDPCVNVSRNVVNWSNYKRLTSLLRRFTICPIQVWFVAAMFNRNNYTVLEKIINWIIDLFTFFPLRSYIHQYIKVQHKYFLIDFFQKSCTMLSMKIVIKLNKAV